MNQGHCGMCRKRAPRPGLRTCQVCADDAKGIVITVAVPPSGSATVRLALMRLRRRRTRRETDDLRSVEAVTDRPVTTADCIDLARALDIDPAGLARTVAEFNAGCRAGKYNPSVLDGVGTEGVSPPKSNWALPIDKPPFHGFVVTCGITFTFGGLKIDETAAVLDTADRPIPGLYAAGELVGGIFYGNYLGGAGLMSGSVFGRIAGGSAAAYAKSRVAAEA